MQPHPDLQSLAADDESSARYHPRSLSKRKFSLWPEWAALCAYAALVASAIPYHEPWADEAQAWQLARTLSLAELFKTFIRFEAAPGLWHLFLRLLIRLHVSYTGMHWICGAIAAGAAGILVFKAPFPRYLKLSLPFTFFLLFQYAVVARNYVLAPLLFFLIAVVWKKNPALLAVLLGLLANVALHAAAISGGLAIVYLIDEVRAGSLKDSSRRRQLLFAVIVLLCFYAFALWTAWPPKELSQHLAVIRGESVSSGAWVALALFWPIWQPFQLSIFFWIAMIGCFYARRCLYYLLPVVFFAGFSGIVHCALWHAGLLVPLLIVLLWISWPSAGIPLGRPEAAGRIAMVILAVIQISGAAYALKFDHYQMFSPDVAGADYLKPFVAQGDAVAITYWDQPIGHAFTAIGILPYYDRNIFVNLPDPYWSWDNNDPTEDRFNAMLPSHPRIVMVEIKNDGSPDPAKMDNPRFQSLRDAGYRYDQSFCGSMPEMIGLRRTYCHVFFKYPGASPAATGTSRN
jgi:hypothetical protein